MALIALGVTMVTMSAQTLLTEATDINSRGLAMGIFNSLQFTGMLSPGLLGNIVQSYGFNAIFSITSIMLWIEVLIVCGLILIPWLGKLVSKKRSAR